MGERQPEVQPYAWVVLSAASMSAALAFGGAKAFGVFYVEFLEKYGEGSGSTAWIASVSMALLLGCGLPCSWLCELLSVRVVMVTGGVIAALGHVISAYVTQMELLYLTYGVITGIGRGMCFTPSLLMVNTYFVQRRAFANGVFAAGSGVGSFALPFVTRVLLDNYGLGGALLIFTGITLNLCVCGALMRPLNADKILPILENSNIQTSVKLKELSCRKELLSNVFERKKESNPTSVDVDEEFIVDVSSDRVNGSVNRVVRAEMEPLNTARKEGVNKTELYLDKKWAKMPYMQKESSIESKLYLVDHDLTKSSGESENSSLRNTATNAQPTCPVHAGTIVSNENHSHSFQIDACCPPFKDIGVNTETGIRDDSENTDRNTKHSYHTSSSKACMNSLDFSDLLRPEKESDDMEINVNQARPVEENVALTFRNHELQEATFQTNGNITFSANISNHNQVVIAESSDKMVAENFEDVIKNVELFQQNASFLQNSLAQTTSKTIASQSWAKCMFKHCKTPQCDVSIAKSPIFLIYEGAFLLMTTGYLTHFIMIPAHAVQLGFTKPQADLLLSIVGIADILGRTLFGWFSDLGFLSRENMSAAMAFLGAISSLLIPFSTTYIVLCAYSAGVGLLPGAGSVIAFVLVTESIGPRMNPSVIGVHSSLFALPALIGPPIAGWLKDGTGSWDMSFRVAGFSLLASMVISLWIGPAVVRIVKRREQGR